MAKKQATPIVIKSVSVEYVDKIMAKVNEQCYPSYNTALNVIDTKIFNLLSIVKERGLFSYDAQINSVQAKVDVLLTVRAEIIAAD